MTRVWRVPWLLAIGVSSLHCGAARRDQARAEPAANPSRVVAPQRLLTTDAGPASPPAIPVRPSSSSPVLATGVAQVGADGPPRAQPHRGDNSPAPTESPADVRPPPGALASPEAKRSPPVAASPGVTRPAKARSPSPTCPYPAVAGNPRVAFERVAGGFTHPATFAVSARARPDKLFVGERGGKIRILEPKASAPTQTFMELPVARREVEMGLLGFALHPQFPDDPRVYLNYNPPTQDRTIVAEYRVRRDDPYRIDTRVRPRVLLDVAQPFGNHNAGMLTFGPEGLLYVGFGDGGSPPPTGGIAAQDLTQLLGKMLRIGVDPEGGRPYQIPPDNPFVGQPNARAEIWALGLRNPWRFDFDQKTGVLYVGDVGENQWEEINVIERGRNYGWGELEGFRCFRKPCDDTAGPHRVNRDGFTAPLVVQGHPDHLSIIGGYVYRSCEVPAWNGTYFYADWIRQDIYGLRWNGTTVKSLGVVGRLPHGMPTTFGTNAWGDVYVLSGHDGSEAVLWRMRPEP
ncbi:MAG: glucose dehydrogenase [Myxococcales bacterium FL481]|nr:MAG: glucose dehydrogenase [Myxococcales bacterium FL481]